MPLVARAGARLGVAGLCLLGANNALQNALAEGDTRTLSFHHLHTGEDVTVTFKRDGRYDEAALKKLDWFMRDWRKQEQTHMDPHLFDVLWEAYREVGATRPIDVVCGYRSPATNAMLRARSSGVAQSSQHTQGHAMDFNIPGVPLEKIREVGLRLQRGGVGFYPTSGSPFVHLDTGSIRHWPRMTYAQLSKVFPDGRTVHVASDGRPLPGYALALADVEGRGNRPNGNSLQAARAAGAITASQEQEAEAAGQRPARSLFAGLFDFSKSKDGEEIADEQAAAAPPSRRARMTTASVAVAKPVATERVVPLPTARPAALAMAKPKPAEPAFTTASISGNPFDSRGLWQNAPGNDADAAAPKPPLAPFDVAAAGPSMPGSTLAYAAESTPPAARVRPMGKTMPKLAREAKVMPVSANSSVVAKAPLTPATTGAGPRGDSPWLRAAMLTPSVSGFLTATRLGEFDPRPLSALIHKPSQSLMMTFSADPALGMLADRFSGPSVVFLATATFTTQTTASLR